MKIIPYIKTHIKATLIFEKLYNFSQLILSIKL